MDVKASLLNFLCLLSFALCTIQLRLPTSSRSASEKECGASASTGLDFHCYSVTELSYILSEPHFLHQRNGDLNREFYIIN